MSPSEPLLSGWSDAPAAQAGLTADLHALGVRPGGILLVHSSLSALGHVPGGPETVVLGLLGSLGPSGTLLMPALTYERVTKEHPVFVTRSTPGNVGTIPEWFRNRAGTLRSAHPTHSVCATGPGAAAMISGHELDTTPVGAHSPFRRVRELNGQILFLGCDLSANTSMHGVEELAEPPYLYGPPVSFTTILMTGETLVREHHPHGFEGVEQRYDRLASLLEPVNAIRDGKTLGGTSILVEAETMWKVALAALRRDPWHFVDRTPAAE